MKASIIDGFPNEFKQRSFKAGFSLPSEKWNALWKQNTVCFELRKGNLLPLHIPEIKRAESTACFLSPSPLPAFFPSCPPSPLPLPLCLFCSCSMTDLDSNAQTGRGLSPHRAVHGPAPVSAVAWKRHLSPLGSQQLCASFPATLKKLLSYCTSQGLSFLPCLMSKQVTRRLRRYSKAVRNAGSLVILRNQF